MIKRLNSDNKYCNRCGKPTKILFHSSKMRFCSVCEGDKLEEKEEITQPDFFIDFDLDKDYPK
jgi:hypothetical protein